MSVKVEVLPIDEGATPDPNNVNKHTQKGGGLLENSLRKRGAFRSIASAGKNTEVPVVMAGNYTLEKAVTAGFTEVVNVHVTGNQLVNVVRDDIEPGTPEAIALGIEDNEIGKQSYNADIDLLAAMAAGDNGVLSQLKKDDKIFGDILTGMGVKDGEPVDAEPQIDRAAELQVKWHTSSGQLWKLGDHRLLCGDSTKREDVERVGAFECCFTFTDPPYNVGIKYTDATDDNQKKEDFIKWCSRWTLFLPDRKMLTVGIKRLVWWGDILGDPQWIIAWVKRNGQGQTGLGGTNKWDAILCYGVEQDHKTDMIELNNDYSEKIKSEGGHPTAKPVELWQQVIDRFTVDKCNVYEPFGGSGTTIIACQNLGRKCRAIEISPSYCAVILERFYTATGILPELVTE